MKNLILTLIITLPLILWGQGWEQTFGEEYISDNFGQSVQQTTDGGYIITGRLSNEVGLIKTDENGDELWSQTFGGGCNCWGSSVQQTTDGGYIITGFTNSSGSNDILLIKTYGWGTEQWSQTFGGDGSEWGRSVQQTTDGGYIITGRTQSFGSGGFDVYLIKTDENGNEIWSQTFGGEGDDESYSVQQTTDGGYIITGYTQSFENGDSDFYLIKTDEDGEELWSQTFGGENDDGGGSVQQTTDGGFIITGYTQSFENGDSDFHLIKTDEDGEELWSQTFGGENDDGSVSVQQTTDGGYIITGSTQSFGSGNRDIYLIKTDENGNELWSQTFGGENNDGGFSVQQTTDGGYIITGSLNGDIYLIKTDEYGNILPYESILNGCDSVQSLINETYIFESGTYINTLTNVFGGDSVVIQNFNIFDSPDYIVIEGDNEVFISSLESYQITISTNNLLEWNVEGGTISEVNGNTIQVLWGDEGIGYVEVTETDTNGCSTTSTLEVTISNEPTNIYEYNTTRKLIKTINLLGQEVKPQKNQSYIEIYDDGTRKRKIIIE